MKILLLTNKSPWPPIDGSASATLSMIRGLIAGGASVTLLAFNTRKHHSEIYNIPDRLSDLHFVDLDTRIRPSGLLFNLIFSATPYTITRFRSRELGTRLTELLKKGFDIVQIEGLAMTEYLPLIRKNSGARIIFRPHNVENIIWSLLAKEESNILRSLYFTITSLKTAGIERKIINLFDGIAAISKTDKDWFINAGCRKPAIVSNPSPSPVETITVPEIPRSVGFIGALDWMPNINGLKWLVKEVWPSVIDNLPEAELYVAGRNPGREIEKICNGKNITFLGEISSSADFIAGKEVLAVPLFSGSGIRMKILEGMNLGKCIVATPVAAAGLIFEDKRDIFIESDAVSFAGRITELLTDGNLRNLTGRRGQENVRKNYNILAATEELLNFYSRLS
jgi:polysaccharide biosynthesis protein PslH